MKTISISRLVLLNLILLITSSINAQYLEQKKSVIDQTPKLIDLNGKANELGITQNQLQEILNSASNNGSGNPLPEAMQERFFTGQAAGDNFGHSVSSAGDVNGDGYDDIIVGAPFSSSSRGKAYLFFGGPVINSIPDAVFSGSSIGAQFGYSVSSAGDLNGDDYDDIVIGAPYEDGTAGRATIIFGNSSMATYSTLIISDPTPDYDELFATSVAGGGDVNGDGYADVVIGSPYDNLYGLDLGAAYVFYGGSSMNAISDVTLAPPLNISSGEFGQFVSFAGDVNGDGFAEVLVMAPGDGSVFLYLGGANMNNAYDLIYSGAYADGAGDVNGDGYSDVVSGGSGEAYVFYGGAVPDNNPDITFTGETGFDGFGNSVAGAGDINGDGYSDILIGALSNDAGGTDAGRAYVYFGGEQMDNIKDAILTGAAAGDWFGLSVAAAGDVNGDSYADIIVGAPRNDTNGSNAGRAYLYTNTLTGQDIPDEFFTGAANSDLFGYSVSAAGDVNGDGYEDIIIGGYFSNSAYIYFGGPAMDNIADVILTGQNAGDYFGYSVCTAGDVNGDGYSDVTVGAFGNDTGGSFAGRGYIYFGGANMDNIADLILTGQSAADRLGISVATAGDINGDGYSDVIIGALGFSGFTGRAYIYFGGPNMNNVADVLFTGEALSDKLGARVSTAGDVNGDGYSDVIVGAIENDAGGTDAGRAYIFFGGVSIDSIADVTLTGAAAGDYFGYSVSTAGDVNGDGYSDVIVGAPHNDALGTSAGRAYIYYGGPSMNNTADVILTGEASNNAFGNSVATAGDVNGDGYSDVIVGAAYNNAFGTYAGRAYIYFGGTDMDNTVDIILTGFMSNGNFGYSVSAAGDINGDGYDDIVVGAPGESADKGKAYLYLSTPPPLKPRTLEVKDVPYDQGGQVYVNFVRSAYDALNESNIITEYVVEMSTPPGVNGFSWAQIGSVQPMQNVYYTFIANTPNDSMTNNSGTYYFRITARTSNPNQYWRSNIVYGHSVDNLAPAAPFSFYANLNGSSINLSWKANTEQDFRNYNIYRSDTPVVEEFILIATTTDTTFVDNSPLSGNAYYYIQAFDIHDNGSPLSADSIEAILSANIRIFLEGSYVGGQMSTFLNSSNLIPLAQPYNTSPWNYTGTESVASIPQNIVDWVLVELRSSETTVVETRAAFLKNDGTLVDLDGTSNIKFPSTPEGEYYVVIKHRNHLPVMTANKVGISFNPALYDMRTDLTKAYGTNALKNLGGGYFGIFTADTDGSGTVNASDRSNTWNQRNLSGYHGADVDLSGTVNAADRSTVWNNRNITTQVPASTDKLSTVKTSGVNENE